MEEIKIDEMILKYNHAESFIKIKEHMESCYGEDLSNEAVAFLLLINGMHAYRFI